MVYVFFKLFHIKESPVWDWHVRTAIFKIDNQQGPTVKNKTKQNKKESPVRNEKHEKKSKQYRLKSKFWSLIWSLLLVQSEEQYGSSATKKGFSATCLTV